jgi:hypothetical protein
MLAALEGIAGVLYMAITSALLVGAYKQHGSGDYRWHTALEKGRSYFAASFFGAQQFFNGSQWKPRPVGRRDRLHFTRVRSPELSA